MLRERKKKHSRASRTLFSISLSASPKMNSDIQGSSRQSRQYIALQDYQAFTPGYLSFTTGDLIDVTENGRLMGRLQNGEEGQITSETLKILFPSGM